jgi:hypothetical protein
MYILPQLLTDYYEAYGERYASIYRPHNEEEWIEETGIITRIKDMTARFVSNLTVDILKNFENDVLRQLKNGNVDMDDMHRLVCNIRDEAIEKFKKLGQGLYNIHCTAFGPI